MDLLEEIKRKLEIIKGYKELKGINSTIVHIERAEILLEKGKKEKDEFFFTDVIYRTNHAFEGILKEAYNILAKKNSSKKTIFEIEEYFNTKDIFNERVLNLFKNYRKDWRNPSTHDYNLFFSEIEAFLAIISISSFIHVLLDQIIEKLSFEREQEFAIDIAPDIVKNIKNYENLNLFEKVIELLGKFDFKKIKSLNKEEGKHSKFELIGAIHAYFNQLDKNLNVIREPVIRSYGKTLRPDFLIEFEDQKVILETRTILNNLAFYNGLYQLSDYLKYAGLKEGILFTLLIMSKKDITNKIDVELKKKMIDKKIIVMSPEVILEI